METGMAQAVRTLDLVVNQFGTTDELCHHIRSSLERGLVEFVPALCSHDGTFVIVGSGPSMPAFVEDIREEKARGRPVCAIKGTHDFLVERGIEPTFFLSIDPRPRLDQVRLKTEDTIYLLASRCHPELFDRLKNGKVVLWHGVAHEDKAADIYRDAKVKLQIGGGTTSGMRAINVAYMMGFRKFVLYGMDSCLAPDGLTKRFNGDRTGVTVDVYPGYFKDGKNYPNMARKFVSNHAMAQQARDFEGIYQHLPGISVESKGDGLITAMIAERKKAGLQT